MVPHVCVSQGHVTKENWCEQRSSTTTGVGTAGDEECTSPDGQTRLGSTWHMTLAYPKAVCNICWMCSSAEATSRAWVDCLEFGRTFNFDGMPCATLQDETSRTSDEGETLLADSAHEATDSELSIIPHTVRISHPVFRICFPLGRAQVRTSLPCEEGVSLLLSRAWHATWQMPNHQAGYIEKLNLRCVLSIFSIIILTWIYGYCKLPHHGSFRWSFVANSASARNLCSVRLLQFNFF